MNIKAQFRHAITSFNREDWDDAKEVLEDMEGETDAVGAESLFEAMALVVSAYSRVHGDDFPDQTAYDRAKLEIERAIEILSEGMPESVLGIRIHSLVNKLEEFDEAVRMSTRPKKFKIELPKDETTHFDADQT
jgi:site-specific recombinase